MTFTDWQNELDSHYDDGELSGATAMVVIAANEVAIASRNARRLILVRQDLAGAKLVVRKSEKIPHKFTDCSYSNGRIYCSCQRTFRDSGHIYIYNATDVTRPFAVVPDDYVLGPIITQPALSVYVFSRSDRPSFVARSKETNAEIAEIQTKFKITQIWGDLVDQGLFYCANAVSRTLERIRWNETSQTFTYEDEITLPYSEGLLSLIVRDGQCLYTTRENVVHYDFETEEVKFNYHDFWAGFGQLDAVSGVDFGDLDDTDNTQPWIRTWQGQINQNYTYGSITARFVVDQIGFEPVYPAGDYRIIFDRTRSNQMATLDGGATWGCPGSTGSQRGYQFMSCTGSPAFNVETGGVGHVGDGFYATEAEALDAYDGSYIDVYHTGGKFLVRLWDDNFKDNVGSEFHANAQAFTLVAITPSVSGPVLSPPGTPTYWIDVTDDATITTDIDDSPLTVTDKVSTLDKFQFAVNAARPASGDPVTLTWNEGF